MIKRIRGGVIILALLCMAGGARAAVPVEDASRAPAHVRRQAVALARWAVTRSMEGKALHPLPFRPEGMLARPGPCFVTISLSGRRKGCSGVFAPQARTLAEEIVQTSVRAWAADQRSRRLRKDQLGRAQFSVTIPGSPRTVPDPSGYPPGVFGLLVEGGGRTGVLLAGEARTVSWQVREAKRQAGLSPSASVTFRVFRAVTWTENPPPDTPAKGNLLEPEHEGRRRARG